MPVTVEWDNEEKTVVRMRLDGNWTWDEVYPASQEGYAMLESVSYVVDLIMDMRQSRGIPNSSIFHARNTIGKRHPRTGLTVFVGANTLFFTIWRVFNRVYASLRVEQQFTFADKIEEAREMLAKHHASRSGDKETAKTGDAEAGTAAAEQGTGQSNG